MRHAFKGWPALLVVGLLVAGHGARAASPLAGKWTVTLTDGGQEITPCIVQVEEKDGKPEVSLVSGVFIFKEAAVKRVSGEKGSLRFTLETPRGPFTFSAYAPKGDKPEKLLGTVKIQETVMPLRLERTELKEMNEKEALKEAPGFRELSKLRRAADDKEKADGLRELLKKQGDSPVALEAALLLVQADAKAGESADKVKADAERYLELASSYGPDMQQSATYRVARGLAGLDKEKLAGLAVEYARQAEKLTPASDTGRTAAVLKVLAQALKKAGKADEAREVDARVVKLEERLDQEFEAKAVPFTPKASAGRSGSGDRVVLVELFTGAQCPPCVAADVAFDAALKVYKPADAVFLQYHLHIPGPDPLTNEDTEARAKFYGDDVEGTPTTFVDGKTTEPLGGGRDDGKDSYNNLRKQIDKDLDAEAGAKIKLDVRRDGDKLELEANVSDLAKPGEKVRLRFVLVEEVARYAGRNGQRLHHHVVRSFPGGVEGKALTDKSSKQTASVSLAELKKGLEEYLSKANKDRPFLDDERPLNLKNLKVVAFIQDDDSKKVLQAAQADVPGAKE